MVSKLNGTQKRMSFQYCNIRSCENYNGNQIAGTTRSKDVQIFQSSVNEPERYQAWINEIQKYQNVSGNVLLCHLHFEKRFLLSQQKGRVVLAKDAIPTIFRPKLNDDGDDAEKTNVKTDDGLNEESNILEEQLERTGDSNLLHDIHSIKFQPFVKLCNECTQKEAKILELQAIRSTQRKLIDELTAKLAEANEKTKPTEESHKQEQKQVIRIVKILKTCTVCGVGKMTPEQNQQHICNGMKKIECQYCDQIFASISDLILHLNDHEFEEVVYKCKFCPKSYGMEMLLQFHLMMHSNAEKMVVISSENVLTEMSNESTELNPSKRRKVTSVIQSVSFDVEKNLVIPSESSSSENEADETNSNESVQSGSISASEIRLSNKSVEWYSNKPVKVVEAKTPLPTDVRPLKCGSCGLCFATGQHLQRHMLDNHRNVYKCVVCKSKFKSLEEVRIHVRSHTGDEKCLVCNEICTKTQIETHMCSDQDSIECSYCLQSFSAMKSLLQHLKECNKETCFYNCIQCSEKFMMKSIAEIHINSHKKTLSKQHQSIETPDVDKNVIKTKPKPAVIFQCTICSKSSGDKELMMQHKKLHDAEKNTVHLCDLCGKEFTSIYGLNDHRAIHFEKTVKCNQCDKKFSTKRGLRKHAVVHSNDKCMCDICGKALACKKGLRKHKELHTQSKETDRKYDCTMCEKKFIRKEHLQKHLITHTTDKPFQCEYCRQKYKYKGDLTKHLRKMHLGDDLYGCTECPKRFRLPWELERHKFEHYVPTEDKKDENLKKLENV